MVKHTDLVDNAGRQIHPLPEWVFGPPVLAADGNGTSSWVSKQASPLFQKGSGYLVKLNSGVQSGDDWGGCYIPSNQLPVYDFNEAMWSWYQTNAEAYGMNMVIWLQNPDDFDGRVEVTQAPSGSTLEKGAGWNAHELDITVTQFFYYGENVTGTDLTAGTQYTWAQFQSDPLFKNWVIYRISFEWGWYSTGTFEDAYLADVSLNGQIIVIQPSTSELLLNPAAIAAGTARIGTVIPGTPFEVRVTKLIVTGGAYGANDVISEVTTNAASTDWDFAGVANATGGYFVIDTAMVISQTPNIAPRFSLILFNAPPTGELDDNAANNSPVDADLAKVLPPIDFSALNPVGTSANSTVVASASTVGNVPILGKCAVGSTTIYGIMTTRDIFTQTAGDNLTVVLTGRQF